MVAELGAVGAVASGVGGAEVVGGVGAALSEGEAVVDVEWLAVGDGLAAAGAGEGAGVGEGYGDVAADGAPPAGGSVAASVRRSKALGPGCGVTVHSECSACHRGR